jgi:ferric-dicitrate binding protein FerR (iron transport regulator)
VDAVLPEDCERARGWASLALDCELSQVERAHLNAHLADCATCATFVAGLREVTHELRAAPLPTPSRPLLPRRRSRRAPGLLAAVAVCVAAGAGGVAGELRHAPPPAAVEAHGATLTLAFRQAHYLPGARLPQRTAV